MELSHPSVNVATFMQDIEVVQILSYLIEANNL